jgi:hypothetical protein
VFCDVFEMSGGKIKRLTTYLVNLRETKQEIGPDASEAEAVEPSTGGA